MTEIKPPYDELDTIINEYVDGYELTGDEGSYTPTLTEKLLIKDAIHGLLADTDWDNAWGRYIAALAKSQPARGPCLIAKALAALEVAQDNLRPHGDNCFLHDEGEYNSCFCGKDSLSNYLQEVVEELSDQAYQPVAWQHCQRSGPDAEWQEWHTVGYKPQGPESDRFKMRPLFTHPVRPMSDEQIAQWMPVGLLRTEEFVYQKGIKDAEKFHGIKGATE